MYNLPHILKLASRVRKEVREGRILRTAVEEFIPTPNAYAEGLNTGSKSILKRYGWTLHQEPDARGAAYAVKKRVEIPAAGVPDLIKGFDPAAHPFINAVTLRHEADEVRSMERMPKQKNRLAALRTNAANLNDLYGSPGAEAIGKRTVLRVEEGLLRKEFENHPLSFSGHITPNVIRSEAQHLNFGMPEATRAFDGIRGPELHALGDYLKPQGISYDRVTDGIHGLSKLTKKQVEKAVRGAPSVPSSFWNSTKVPSKYYMAEEAVAKSTAPKVPFSMRKFMRANKYPIAGAALVAGLVGLDLYQSRNLDKEVK